MRLIVVNHLFVYESSPFKNISISHDMTKNERDQNKAMFEETKRLNTISSQIGPKSNRLQSNRPQFKSASSQIGPKSNRPQNESHIGPKK